MGEKCGSGVERGKVSYNVHMQTCYFALIVCKKFF